MAHVLELACVTKRFSSHAAVDQLTFDVEEGEFFALLGPSGCGKTTTLRMIAGFEQPTSGEIRLRGNSIQHLPPYARNVSTVFQSYALFPHLTVRQNIEFGLRHRPQGWNAEAAERVTSTMEMLQIARLANTKPALLSGGECQRVALARSLVLHPDVLLLDEPLSALDPNLRKQVRAELKALQRQVGITFLLVTHDREEALSLSDRVAVLNQGRLEQVGSPREVYLRPQSRFAASFLGPMNWINGVGLRPEATRLSYETPNGDSRSVPAKVVASTFLGSCFHVDVRLVNGESAIAEISRLDDAFREGDAVHVWWNPYDEMPL